MKTTVLDSINQGLLSALKKDPTVIFLGEDILDPYGGAFRATRGCSTAFPDRVITTPISEAGLGGLATGLALRGLRPVVEVMFGDFMTLLADGVVNHMTKFSWMYRESVSVPLLIRTPMGGGRGYGPTHSQSLEKLFLGVPGLTVLAPVNYDFSQKNGSPGALLAGRILGASTPTLFIENKLQYLLPLLTEADLLEFDIDILFDPAEGGKDFPIFSLKIKGAPPPTITIAAYGYMAELARQAQLKLAFEEEIFTELIVPTRLSPFKLDPLLDSVGRTLKVLVIEEGTRTLGWGAEVIAIIAEKLAGGGLKQVQRVAAAETPVPAARSLEKTMLPQFEDILVALRRMNG
ncbi:MAG: alpha-ketoacid dehydrogenase subunit beta [Chloroflexi bacterium]|nr:alpha-ketoacid dehydrogenase subunit beta [Chloroflexota bacterium]